MRILVVGQYGGYRERGYTTTTCLIAREQEVSRALASFGHDVSLLGDPSNPAVVAGVRIAGRVTPPVPTSVVDPRNFDAVLGMTEFASPWIKHNTEEPDLYFKHPNFAYWLDSWLDSEDMSHAAVIASSTPNVVREHRKRCPNAASLLLPWAVTEPEAPPPLPAGWTGTRPRLLYCGFLDERIIHLLNQISLSEITEVWIAGCWGGHGGYTGFTDESRARMFHSRVRFLTDVLGPPVDAPPRDGAFLDPRWPHGPVQYGEQFPYYYHASVTICFAREPSRRGVFSSKLYDQLSSGTPVICEQYVQNAGDVVNFDAGLIVPYGDVAAMIRAVDHLQKYPPDRWRIREEVRAFGTWEDRARVLEAYLRPGSRLVAHGHSF